MRIKKRTTSKGKVATATVKPRCKQSLSSNGYDDDDDDDDDNDDDDGDDDDDDDDGDIRNLT